MYRGETSQHTRKSVKIMEPAIELVEIQEMHDAFPISTSNIEIEIIKSQPKIPISRSYESILKISKIETSFPKSKKSRNDSQTSEESIVFEHWNTGSVIHSWRHVPKNVRLQYLFCPCFVTARAAVKSGYRITASMIGLTMFYSAFKNFGPVPKFGDFWRFSE